MHSESQRTVFCSLRAQGWSLGRIASHLNIPKSTLYGWDHADRPVTAVPKVVRAMTGSLGLANRKTAAKLNANPNTQLRLVAPSCT